MKRSGALLLTLMYTITVLGFALNLSYWGTQVGSAKTPSPLISCKTLQSCGKIKSCKDKQLQIKEKNDDQAEPASTLSRLLGFDIPSLSFSGFFSSSQQSSVVDAPLERGQPDKPWQNLTAFIQNLIFHF